MLFAGCGAYTVCGAAICSFFQQDLLSKNLWGSQKNLHQLQNLIFQFFGFTFHSI
jgi:hypothetical protein